MDSIETNLTPTLHIDAYGTKRYYLPDVKTLHREDGPAVEIPNGNGIKFWYHYGKRHREDGPAIEWSNGAKDWYYHGQKIPCNSQEEFLSAIKLVALL